MKIWLVETVVDVGHLDPDDELGTGYQSGEAG